MFVIIVYDVGEKRVNRVRKHFKMYLTWTQNSVFEGEIKPSKLNECLGGAKRIMNFSEDSLYIYKDKYGHNIEKIAFGKEKNRDDLFI